MTFGCMQELQGFGKCLVSCKAPLCRAAGRRTGSLERHLEDRAEEVAAAIEELMDSKFSGKSVATIEKNRKTLAEAIVRALGSEPETKK